MNLSATVVIRIVMCVGLSVAATAATFFLSRQEGERSRLWLAPALTAAALSGLALAVYLGVRQVIQTFQWMATHGGGIGSASAGVWESIQPLHFAAYAATVIAIVELITVHRRRTVAESSDSQAGRAATLILLFFISCGTIAIACVSFFQVTELIVDVINPNSTTSGSMAQISTRISRSLIWAAATGVAGVIILLAVIPISLVIGRSIPANRTLERLTTVALLVVVLLSTAISYKLTRWSNVLEETAISGSFPKEQ